MSSSLRMSWIGLNLSGLLMLSLGLSGVARAATPGSLEAQLEAEAQSHHVEVSNWPGLVLYAGYQAVKTGHLAKITSNVSQLVHLAGSGNLANLSPTKKEAALQLAISTAALANVSVTFLDSSGHPVQLSQYEQQIHPDYQLELTGNKGQDLSTVTIPWSTGKALVTESSTSKDSATAKSTDPAQAPASSVKVASSSAASSSASDATTGAVSVASASVSMVPTGSSTGLGAKAPGKGVTADPPATTGHSSAQSSQALRYLNMAVGLGLVVGIIQWLRKRGKTR